MRWYGSVLHCSFWLSFSVLSRSLAGRRTPKKPGLQCTPAETSPKRHDKTRWYIGNQTQPYKKLLSMTSSASTVPMVILERYDLIEVFLHPKRRMNRLIVLIISLFTLCGITYAYRSAWSVPVHFRLPTWSLCRNVRPSRFCLPWRQQALKSASCSSPFFSPPFCSKLP